VAAAGARTASPRIDEEDDEDDDDNDGSKRGREDRSSRSIVVVVVVVVVLCVCVCLLVFLVWGGSCGEVEGDTSISTSVRKMQSQKGMDESNALMPRAKQAGRLCEQASVKRRAARVLLLLLLLLLL
jgi:hypothetical protein